MAKWDDAVLRIERGYEVRGMLESLTSYDAARGGNVVDQVLREFNDWGLLSWSNGLYVYRREGIHGVITPRKVV